MKRPCLESYCSLLVESPAVRCPVHIQAAAQRDAQHRGSAQERGYDAAWQAVRNAYVREHPLCEDHLERGGVVATEIVDHVIPLPHGPRLDPSNLRSLCRSCHATKTAQDVRAEHVGHIDRAEPEEKSWIIA